MLLLLFLSMRLAAYLARRAICQLVGLFRQRNALQPQDSIPFESLGFSRFPFLHLIRDYRPWAFQTLLQAGIIKSPLDGWFYLSEQTLVSAGGIKCAVSPLHAA